LEQWLNGISICKDSIDNEVDSEMPDYSVDAREAHHQQQSTQQKKVLPISDAEMFDLASETDPASQNPLKIDHSNTELKPCASQQETAPPVSMRDSNHAD
jgi:hypothetical protein